jgi:hypothetical protein
VQEVGVGELGVISLERRVKVVESVGAEGGVEWSGVEWSGVGDVGGGVGEKAD